MLAGSESKLVKEKLDALNKAFELINLLGSDRRLYLEERREFHRFVIFFSSFGFENKFYAQKLYYTILEM